MNLSKNLQNVKCKKQQQPKTVTKRQLGSLKNKSFLSQNNIKKEKTIWHIYQFDVCVFSL